MWILFIISCFTATCLRSEKADKIQLIRKQSGAFSIPEVLDDCLSLACGNEHAVCTRANNPWLIAIPSNETACLGAVYLNVN